MLKQLKDLELYEIDYLVAKAEENRYVHLRNNVCYANKTNNRDKAIVFTPTTNALQAGKIIEREKITIIWDNDLNIWSAEIVMLHKGFITGKTALEAAMRCYCISIYGNEVEV